MRNWMCGLGALLLVLPAMSAGCGGDDDDDGGGTAAEGGTSGTGAGTGGTSGTGTGSSGTSGTGTGTSGAGGSSGSGTGGSSGSGTSGASGSGNVNCPDQPAWGQDCTDDGQVCTYDVGGFGTAECTCSGGTWDCAMEQGGAGAGGVDPCPGTGDPSGDTCDTMGDQCTYDGSTCMCFAMGGGDPTWNCFGGGGFP